ncbi:MAG TPA: AsmA-like C-terminal region-containing protein [Cytophagaceae bacterium]|nr:AsmA-like C-terminal region-containing protein [Cytophagaceae bacterium]
MRALRIIKKTFLYGFLTIILLLSSGVALTYIFEDKIIALTLEELNKYLKVKIEVDKKIELSIFDKFPQVSIAFKDVKIYESIEGSQQKMGALKQLYFSFDVYDFIKGKYVINHISISNGRLDLKTDKNGHINYSIIKDDSVNNESSVRFHLRKIDIENVEVVYDNRNTNQYYAALAKSNNATLKLQNKVLDISLQGNFFVHSIIINDLEHFANKDVSLSLFQQYDQTKKIFTFLPSELHIQNSSYTINGSFQFKEKKYIELVIAGKNTSISNLLSLLPSKISDNLNTYKASGEVYFASQIKGYISETENPGINIDFGFENAAFSHPNFNEEIKGAELKGNFNNGMSHNSAGSSLQITNIQGIFAGQAFKAGFSMQNFEDPTINLQFTGDVNVETLLRFYPVEYIKTAHGMVGLDILFSGKTNDLRTHEGKKKIKTEGAILIKNIRLEFKNEPLIFSRLNGHFTFNKNDLDIKEFTGYIGQSDLQIKGTLKNFFSKALYSKEKLIVDAMLESSLINLDELLKQKSSSATGSTSSKDSLNMPLFLKDYIFRIEYRIKNLHFHKLHAKDIDGKIKLDYPFAQVDFKSFKAADGNIELSSFINFRSFDKIEINAKADLNHICIDSVLFICDNFNQTFLTSKNIKGEFKGKTKVMLTMNHNLEIDPASVIASIDAYVIKGQLVNFEPMRKLSKFINERELENIRFSELKNNIYIEGEKINIPEMVIKSNISDISISGTHTFDQHIDYKLAVPLKNLRQKFKDNHEANAAIDDNGLGRATIYLTIKGTADNYKIAYDTKRTRGKIKDDLKKEKKELQDIFKKKEEEQVKTQQLNEEEFMDID